MKKINRWMIGSALRLRSKLEEDNRGMGTVEIILIIVVLVGVVVIFKNQLNQLCFHYIHLGHLDHSKTDYQFDSINPKIPYNRHNHGKRI